jgi:hypothetical protein
MAISDKTKCLDCLDFSSDWSAWRKNFKKNLIGEQHFYWRDEAVKNIAERLDSYLDKNIDVKAPEEELMKEMWDVASIDERKSLAMVLLKLVEKS